MPKYVLNDNLFASLTNTNFLQLSLPNEENVKFPPTNHDFILTVLDLFIKPQDQQSLSKALSETKFDVDDITALFNLLKQHNIIKIYTEPTDWQTTLTAKQLAKYDRQLRNFAALPGNTFEDALRQQERLSNAKVLVIGVGGLGSYLSTGLAQIGIGTIHLIDFDDVELSNTSRQILYREKNIGDRKIPVALENLREIAPDSSFIGHELEIRDAESLIEEVGNDTFDIAAICADKPLGEMAYIADTFSRKTGTPILYGGPYAGNKIFLGPLIIPRKTKSYSQLIPKNKVNLKDSRINRINAHRISTIVDTDNALAAKMMESEIIKFIGKTKQPTTIERQITLSTWTWETKNINLTGQED